VATHHPPRRACPALRQSSLGLVQVQDARCGRTDDRITGVDLGVSSAATRSSGEKISAPRPLRAALGRLRIRTWRLSRKLEAARRPRLA